MTIIGVIHFLIKKVAKLVETKFFCQNRLNHLILHFEKNQKECTLLCFICQKIPPKDVSSFSRKFKNCQNHGLFEGAVMEGRIYPTG